mmetsp:Transcript_6527/g.16184  ORF Transcript_6527/g.16184 Transcript_6527/m.16184 type:complete len:386 (+) Transcript_6527:163-1320(+)
MALAQSMRILAQCIGVKDEDRIAREMTLDLSPDAPIVHQLFTTNLAWLNKTTSNLVPAPLTEAAKCFYKSLFLLVKGSLEEAVAAHIDMTTKLREVLLENTWLLPAYCRAGRDLRRLCLKAINEDIAVAQISTTVIDALTKMFKTINGEPALKIKAVHFVNDLVRVQFKTNNLLLTANLFAALRDIGKTAKAEQVTFNFYSGRLAILKDDLSGAEMKLESALKICPAWAQRQRRQILCFLIPVRVLQARLPSKQLLVKYGLDGLFGDLVDSVRTGDIQRFERALTLRERGFMRNGTYLIVEKWGSLVLRRLVQRIFWLKHEQYRLKLAHVRKALSWQRGEELSQGEVQSIVAGLCSRKLIQGTVFPSHDLCSLSKKEPFPKNFSL